MTHLKYLFNNARITKEKKHSNKFIINIKYFVSRRRYETIIDTCFHDGKHKTTRKKWQIKNNNITIIKMKTKITDKYKIFII